MHTARHLFFNSNILNMKTEINQMMIGLRQDSSKWYRYYNGLVYANKRTDINTAITNKGKQQSK